jgi:hypothetical protein
MGRTKLIETPEKLYDLFVGYKTEIEGSSKWTKVQYVGKDGARAEDAVKVPLTMEGFERYCHNLDITIRHYFDNPDGAYDDFRVISTRIKNEIREDQITGGLLGFYNHSITARLNGLVEKSENKTDLNIKGITGLEVK